MSSESEAAKLRRKLVSKGELRGECDKQKRTASHKEPSKHHLRGLHSPVVFYTCISAHRVTSCRFYQVSSSGIRKALRSSRCTPALHVCQLLTGAPLGIITSDTSDASCFQCTRLQRYIPAVYKISSPLLCTGVRSFISHPPPLLLLLLSRQPSLFKLYPGLSTSSLQVYEGLVIPTVWLLGLLRPCVYFSVSRSS